MQSGTKAQPEISSHPRTTYAREAWKGDTECQATLLRTKGCQNLIVKCKAQSVTKALPLGRGPGVSSMNEPWEVNGVTLNWDNLHLFSKLGGEKLNLSSWDRGVLDLVSSCMVRTRRKRI